MHKMSLSKRSKCIIFNWHTQQLNHVLIKNKLKALNFVNVNIYETNDFDNTTFEHILSEESSQDYSACGCLVVCIFATLDTKGNFLCVESSERKYWFNLSDLRNYFKSTRNLKDTLIGKPTFFFLNDNNVIDQKCEPFLHLQQNIDVFVSINRFTDHSAFWGKLCDSIGNIEKLQTKITQDITDIRPYWQNCGERNDKNEKCKQFTRMLLDLSDNCFTDLSFENIYDNSGLKYDNETKGKLLIMNCQAFDLNRFELPQSTKQFVDQIRKTFSRFHFDIGKTVQNFSEEELRKELSRVKKSRVTYSFLVLCIITYGDETTIHCRNKVINLIKFINDELNDDELKKFVGKPKFVFIQNCQKTTVNLNENLNKLLPFLSELQFDCAIQNLVKEQLPNDYLLLYCTHQMYSNSKEVFQNGYWTIPLFCEAVDKFASKYDLLTICKIVFFAYSNNYRSFWPGYCFPRNFQLKSTLSKKLFLKVVDEKDKTAKALDNNQTKFYFDIQQNKIPKLHCKRDALFYNMTEANFTGRLILLNYIDLEQNPKIDKAICVLKETFQMLNFSTRQLDPMSLMTKQTTFNILKEESIDLENLGCDCLIVFVLTSGDTSQVIDQEEMIECFSVTKNLNGKPKLFIIQAYTDYINLPFANNVQHDSSISRIDSNIFVIPKYADILLFCSSFDTLAFVNTFCHVLRQHSSRRDLIQMFTAICCALSNCQANYKQIPYIDSTLTRLLRFDTSNCDFSEQSGPLNVYSNTNKTTGQCIILNYEIFDQVKPRVGTEKDVKSIRNTFNQFGFKVIERKNLSAYDTMEFLKLQATKIDSDCDCFVLFVLTHGESNRYVWCKDTLLKLDEMLDCFGGNNCPNLEGKPRIVIVEACQGTKLDSGVTVQVTKHSQSHDSTVDQNKAFHLFDHFVVFFSSYPGFVSWRNREKGTWFIQSLCKVIDRYYDYDLLTMFSMVCQEVAYNEMTLDGNKQIPCMYSTLKGLVSFNFETIFPSYFE